MASEGPAPGNDKPTSRACPLSKLDRVAVMLGAMSAADWLILCPTPLERDVLLKAWPAPAPAIELVGFGPVAAAAVTSRLLTAARPARALLVGIAGSFDQVRLPLGAAHTFDEVALDHLGVGYGREAMSARELGFAQLEGDPPVFDRLALDTCGIGAGLLVTTPVASAQSAEAAARRARFANPLAEDMEAFGVALACHLAGVPLTVVRGASNTVGERDKSAWRIRPALEAAAHLAHTITAS